MSCHLKDGDCRITLKTMKLRNQMGESCDGEAVGCGEDVSNHSSGWGTLLGSTHCRDRLNDFQGWEGYQMEKHSQRNFFF